MTTQLKTRSGEPQHLIKQASSPRRLAFKWLITFRWHLLALFLSDLGRSMVGRKYDAFTTDNGYRAEPVGRGRIERTVDGIVRRRDTHVALRQRLEIVTSELTEVALSKREHGPIRIASGPVGLGRDVRGMWDRLVGLGTAPAGWIELVGVDLDDTDTVLDEASRLAGEAGVPLQAYRRDLLDSDGVLGVLGGPADVFNCIGLSTWLDDTGLRRLLGSLREALADDGALIIDNWRSHQGSKYVGALEMPARYLTDQQFEDVLTQSGFVVNQKRVTGNGVVVVYRVTRDG